MAGSEERSESEKDFEISKRAEETRGDKNRWREK